MKPVVRILLIIGAIALAIWAVAAIRTAREAERNAAMGASLTERFRGARQLKVATIEGVVTATASDARGYGLLVSRQTARTPYSVDYFVDLSRLGPRDYRWDAKARTLTITIPAVTVAAPNIREDAGAAETDGLFVTRDAATALARANARAATTRVAAAANAPAAIARAEENARKAVAALAGGALAASGQGDVRVTVRLATDPVANRAEWDRSRSLAEVLEGR